MSLKFGWCLDGHHDSCPVRTTGSDHILTCSCPCHVEEPA